MGRHGRGLLAAALALIPAAVVVARRRRARLLAAEAAAAAVGARRVDLSAQERRDAALLKPISTLNLYDGALRDEQLAFLRERIAEVARANPWLVGTLAPSVVDPSAIALYVPDGAADEGADVSALLTVADEPALARGLGLVELSALAAARALGAADPSKREGRTRGRVFQVAALRGTRCAGLVVSLSHSVADGHTFYRLYRMLGGVEPVVALRRGGGPYPPMPGHERVQWVRRGPLLNFLYHLAMAPGVDVGVLEIDRDAARAMARARARTAEVPYVSSLDVIASALFTTLGKPIGSYQVDPRGKFGGAGPSADEAGFFAAPFTLLADEFCSPEGVRRPLLDGRLPMRPELPGLPRSIAWGLSILSSWEFGPVELRLPGLAQAVHAPCIPLRPPPPAVVVIFTPRDGATAMFGTAPDEATAARIRALPFVKGQLEAWPQHG